MSRGMSLTSHCSNITTMEFLRHSTARVGCDFLLKISVLRAKGISKNVPNLEVYDPAPAHFTTLLIKIAIVVLY